jgi:hypothetical protein
MSVDPRRVITLLSAAGTAGVDEMPPAGTAKDWSAERRRGLKIREELVFAAISWRSFTGIRYRLTMPNRPI